MKSIDPQIEPGANDTYMNLLSLPQLQEVQNGAMLRAEKAQRPLWKRAFMDLASACQS
jgi:hypothetical protein